MENIINEILKSMGKIYFRDVSRRLLLFALLLLGVVTQAMAVDRYVIVFKELASWNNGNSVWDKCGCYKK